MKSHSECILIIDSDSEARDDLALCLEDRGYYVRTAGAIEEAAAMLAESVPDLIFADLPPEAIRTLSQQGAIEDARIPIVAFSHARDAREVIEAMRSGAEDFLIKPFKDRSTIDEMLGKLFERVRLTRLNQMYRQELESTNRDLRAGIAELQADQRAGRKVQMKMLPEHQRQFCGLEFDHIVKPSLYLSGDFLDYVRLDDHKALVYIADVSGHGASSAFVTVLLKNLTNRLQRNLRRGSSDDILYPDRFLVRVNKELQDTSLGKHVTLFVGLLDTQAYTLTYAVGGHFPMPILVSPQGAAFLEGNGLPVGLFDKPQWDIYTQALPKDFTLFLFSDGILEVIDAKGLDEKENRLLEVVSEGRHTVAALEKALGLEALNELPDDIAIVSVTDRAAVNHV
ncbi:SpoIIE family protein phosphatase [Marinobacteraceae bacterium S3BR75-40.1]